MSSRPFNGFWGTKPKIRRAVGREQALAVFNGFPHL